MLRVEIYESDSISEILSAVSVKVGNFVSFRFSRQSWLKPSDPGIKWSPDPTG